MIEAIKPPTIQLGLISTELVLVANSATLGYPQTVPVSSTRKMLEGADWKSSPVEACPLNVNWPAIDTTASLSSLRWRR